VQERTQHQQQHKANTIDKPTIEGAGAVISLHLDEPWRTKPALQAVHLLLPHAGHFPVAGVPFAHVHVVVSVAHDWIAKKQKGDWVSHRAAPHEQVTLLAAVPSVVVHGLMFPAPLPGASDGDGESAVQHAFPT